MIANLSSCNTFAPLNLLPTFLQKYIQQTVYSIQLYNTLSAEERAVMIDDAGKQRLTLSFYAYAQIQDPTISKRFIPCLGSFSSSRPIYVKEGYQCAIIIACR
jgi:hypothetical protein